MKKYLLDTNICIYYLKNEHNIAEKIAEVGFENCFISELTLAELLFGVKNSSEQHQVNNQKRYDILSEAMSKQILPIRTAFENYATEKAKLKKTGQMIGEIDMFIASTALVNNMILVTRNIKHFERIEGLSLENWVEIE
jgi:tRNA(fMet)-specific endonuclease VapC